MSHNIVTFRWIIWSAGFCNAGRPHARGRADHQRRHRSLGYGMVALLAVAPYLLIVAVMIFYA